MFGFIINDVMYSDEVFDISSITEVIYYISQNTF